MMDNKLDPPRLPADLIALMGIITFAILASLPLFQFKVMTGHDAYAYLPRIIEFYQGLKSGQWFPRWAPDASGGYGQPLFNFAPPLIYYAANLLHVLGFSFLASMNLTSFLLMVLSGITMYLFAREFFGHWGGLIAGVAYIFAPYHLVCLYVRHALADFSAFPFIPLALWAIYRYSHNGKYTELLIGTLSVALLILSSNSVAVMAMPALMAYVLLLAWEAKKLSYFFRGFVPLLSGSGLSAFFALPGVLEHHLVHAERLLVGYFHYVNHFVYLHQFILSAWGYGQSNPGTARDGMSFEIGIIYLLCSAACLWRLKRIPKSIQPHLQFFLIVLASAVFFSTAESIIFWQKLPLLRYLQFPWRFLALAAMATSLMCGFPILAVQDHPKMKIIVFSALLVGIAMVGIPRARPEGFNAWTDADFSPERIVREFIPLAIEEEFEPIWMQERPSTPAVNKLEVLTGVVTILEESVQPTQYDFLIEADGQSLLRVNTFYFPGWKVFVDGQPAQLNYANEFGLMTFEVGAGRHKVQVVFTDTPVRKAGTALSIAALAFLLVFGIATSKRTIR